MDRKILLSLIIIGFIFVFGIIFFQETSNKIDCNKPFEVVYLKPSEISHASQIVNRVNGVVVIPELSRVIARTEILECPNFKYNDYLNVGGD